MTKNISWRVDVQFSTQGHYDPGTDLLSQWLEALRGYAVEIQGGRKDNSGHWKTTLTVEDLALQHAATRAVWLVERATGGEVTFLSVMASAEFDMRGDLALA
jgi:hypothetical protein